MTRSSDTLVLDWEITIRGGVSRFAVVHIEKNALGAVELTIHSPAPACFSASAQEVLALYLQVTDE